jgi:predicted amidohydrolase YtcJ
MANNKRLVLYNAFCYDENYMSKQQCIIIIENGAIKSVIYEKNIEDISFGSGYQYIDCNGCLVIPGFVDSHLHLPGSCLYQAFGIDFSDDRTINDYIARIRNTKQKNYKTIRGYGWNKSVLNSIFDLKKLKAELDMLYTNIPAILFSSDYHSCICNQYLLGLYRPYSINKIVDETGLLEEQDVFGILHHIPCLSFGNSEIGNAVDMFQTMLLKYGITSAQSLMFLGGNGNDELNVLKEMDENSSLKIRLNLALNVFPSDTCEEIFEKYKLMQKYKSKKISINTVKIYIDGVVENKTAYLLEPYENTCSFGTCLWDEEELIKLCCFLDEKDIQIHAHAVGDAAVNIITKALCFAMEKNNTKGKRRHVITHLQLAEEKDINLMGEYGIIACVQPYWFPKDNIFHAIDINHLGNRVYSEYKANSFYKKGIRTTASSDSPVTRCPNPFLGMDLAVNRQDISERTSLIDILHAFSDNGAFQLGRENEIGFIKEGYKADLLLISEDLFECKPECIKNVRVLLTISDGIIRYKNIL